MAAPDVPHQAQEPVNEQDDPPVIRFKDAVGRKFRLPYDMVRQWEGMRDMIDAAFLRVDVLGPHVRQGHYDLIGPSNEIILPATWSALIRPGMSITMTMWPMEKPPRPVRPPGFPQPSYPADPPPFSPSAPAKPGPTNHHHPPPPPPPPPGDQAPAESGHQARKVTTVSNGNVVIDRPSVPHKSEKKDSVMLSFLAGKQPNSKKKKRSEKTIMAPQTVPTLPLESPPRHEHPAQFQQQVPAEHHHSVPTRGSYNVPPPPGWLPGVPRGYTAPPPPPPPPWSVPNPPRHGKASKAASERIRSARPSSSGGSSDSSSSSSQSERSESITSRNAARKSGLVFNARRQANERQVTRRQSTLPIFEPKPEIREFSSARIYSDEISAGSVTLELTERTEPPGAASASNDSDRITWINVSRAVMDFAEFENIALHGANIAISSDIRLAMEMIFKKIYDKKLNKSRSNWFIQPGTALRCDVDSGGETVASVLFASMPQVHVDSFNAKVASKSQKGVCLPRRLHEVFNPYDTSFERDKNQVFLREDGAGSGDILWIGETWILVIDSTHVITYGNPRRKTTLQENIDIRERATRKSSERVVQVTTSKDLRFVQFQIPLDSCETFFKLQSCVEEQLSDHFDLFDFDFGDYQLVDNKGDALTARSWSRLTKHTQESIIRIKAEAIIGDKSSTDSSSGFVHGSSSSASSTSRRRGSFKAEDEGFFGIKRIPSVVSEDDASTLPDLHPQVPPFLSWSILDSKASSSTADVHANHERSTSEGDLKESIRACLVRTETALIEQHHPHVADLQTNFPALNFSEDSTVQTSFEDAETKLSTLFLSERRPHDSRASALDDGDLSRIYREYLSISLRTLEAFALKTHGSPLLSLYYSNLLRTSHYLKYHPPGDCPQRWIISRKPIPIPGYRLLDSTLAHDDCKQCEDGTIYDTSQAAIEHLRSKHLSETTSMDRIKDYLMPLSTAIEERYIREIWEILNTSVSIMTVVAKEARDLQDGVVFGDRFRQPTQGIPYALLKALQLIIAFACTVPALLDEFKTLYSHRVLEREAQTLSPSQELREKARLLKSTGVEIGSLMKTAARALIGSEETRKREDITNFFCSVGAHGVAMQMICNIFLEPVYNNLSAAELYRNYTDNLGSKVIRRPNKRQISVISAMMDEMSRLNKVREWQHKVIRSLQTILSPDTHLTPLKDLRDKTYEIERYILDDVSDKLDEQSDIFQSNLEQGDKLIQVVNDTTEITKDDYSRAIFVFTVVTVIFLPLSFVAAYLSMNGGPSEDGWVETQALFWQIATPLAVAIGIFCLVVALQGYKQTAKRWITHYSSLLGLRRWRLPWSKRKGSEMSSSLHEYSSDTGTSSTYDHSRTESTARRRRRRR